MKIKTILVASCFIASMAVSGADAPAPPHVIEVIVLDVGANMQKFIDQSNRATAIMKKLQVGGTVRYYRSSWAGEGTGHVIVTIEYPSLVAFAQGTSKLDASPDFQRWRADAAASGIKELSSSIVTELRF